MKILALEAENPEPPQKEMQPYLIEEAQTAWRLMQTGIIRDIYFRADDHTAVIMMETQDIDEAVEKLDELPLVREGFIRFDVMQLDPYDGFARLFR